VDCLGGGFHAARPEYLTWVERGKSPCMRTALSNRTFEYAESRVPRGRILQASGATNSPSLQSLTALTKPSATSRVQPSGLRTSGNSPASHRPAFRMA
jgi:hypothetical protein